MWTSPNQLVAFNLWRARTLRNLTQEQAAEVLEPFLGERWSKATFSAAERSFAGGRVRQFTADHVVAFAQAFRFPIPWFFLPPDVLPHTDDPKETRELATLLVAANPEASREHVLEDSDLIDLIFNDDLEEERQRFGESWLERRLRDVMDRIRPERATAAQRRLHEHAERLTKTLVGLHAERLANQTRALRSLVSTLEQVQQDQLDACEGDAE